MAITLIQAPVATGTTQKGMTLAPHRYLQAGIEGMLARHGQEPHTVRAEHAGPVEDDLEMVAEVNVRVAGAVREASRAGHLPLVLGDACNVCLGALSGLQSTDVGVVWLDAHGDFNTPETIPSGYFDGMPLAIATGRAYQDLRRSIGNSEPVPDSHVLVVGVRDLDPAEAGVLHASEVQVVTSSELRTVGIRNALLPALDRLAQPVSAVYLHLDIDVLDPGVAPGVNFPTPDGILVEQAEEIIGLVAERLQIEAASLTALDPTRDEDDKTLRAGLRLARAIAAAVVQPDAV